MIISKDNKATLAKLALDLVAGTQKHTPNGSFTIGSESFTAANLVQLLQGLADAIAKVDDAKAAWQDALTSLDDEQAKVAPVLRGYRNLLLATYGNAPATLADYGLAPRKGPTPPSADVKAAAVAKRAATRKARHTMGKKQKAEIKRNGARDHGSRSRDRRPRFAARRTEPRRECPEHGHERRGCTSHGVSRRGDGNKGRGRTVTPGGASPARSRAQACLGAVETRGRETGKATSRARWGRNGLWPLRRRMACGLLFRREKDHRRTKR